jgi:hypothetical protein
MGSTLLTSGPACPNLVGVDFSARADRTYARDAVARYANKRAEMWGFMKEWLKVGSLPDDNELSADRKAVDYGYDAADASCWSARTTGAAAALPRPTTATRWLLPLPIRSPSATGPRSGGSRKGFRD